MDFKPHHRRETTFGLPDYEPPEAYKHSPVYFYAIAWKKKVRKRVPHAYAARTRNRSSVARAIAWGKARGFAPTIKVYTNGVDHFVMTPEENEAFAAAGSDEAIWELEHKTLRERWPAPARHHHGGGPSR